jgi:thioredoxin reductase/CRP-like cAMP-binding protein/ferredoxin-like protein FixX
VPKNRQVVGICIRLYPYYIQAKFRKSQKGLENMGASPYKIAVVGSGPAGLSAAARAAETGVSHVLLEAENHLSNTIYRYQKGKHVMAEPAILPLRAPVPFEAGKRETILKAWDDGTARLKVNVRHKAEVKSITGEKGAFEIKLTSGDVVLAENVVLAIGLQGNLRKLGCAGEDFDFVQYQLDDPDAYQNEDIVVVGAGDAAIENALALSGHNRVTIINRRDEFDRAKEANNAAILKAIQDGSVHAVYNAAPAEALQNEGGKPKLVLNTAQGQTELPCDRVIARLGATPPRTFVESCGIVFPNKDPNAVPAVSGTYESNVAGLYIIGALAGFPLIKQAMNQGYEVVEFIQGKKVEPADEPLLRAKFKDVPHWGSVEAGIAHIQKRAPVLAPLTALQLREFLLDSDIRQPKSGAVIFAKNDYSDTFYSIIEGSVWIELDPSDKKKGLALGVGQFFGEMSLISGRRRSATIRAGEGCVLVETPRRSMNKLIASSAGVKRVIDETFLLRAIQGNIAPGVPVEQLKALAASAQLQRWKAGEILFKEGQAGDCLHLIRKGSVTVSRLSGAREVVLAYVPAGQYLGEMALISDLPRSATAKAAVASETIRLDGNAFKALLEQRPDIAEKVEAVYKKRLTHNVAASQNQQGSQLVNFFMQQGLGEATDVLLIDESLCVRCDHCEKACADTHGNVSRLDREAGPTFANVHVPTSCRHCEHPHCMKDCPPDAIKRSPGGEVYITDACIGCGNCSRNCPYGVIQMGVETPKSPSLFQWFLFGGLLGGAEPGDYHPQKSKEAVKKAAKCDMCKDQKGGPACVRACPTGAALRVSPEKFQQLIKGRA